MVIIQLDKEQLGHLIKDSIRTVLSEKISTINQDEYISEQPLTVRQAAKFLNLSPSTIYSLVRHKAIPYTKLSKRLYFFKKDLIEYLKKGRNKTIDEIKAELNQYLVKKKGGKP